MRTDIVHRISAEMLNTSMQDITAEVIYGWATRLSDAATCDKSSQVGNAAALLEALKSIIEDGVSKYLSKEINDVMLCRRIENIVKEALAKPPRNCDVGTAKKQSLRFEDFCNLHRSCEKGCRDCPLLNCEPCCELEWAQMPYRKGATHEQ